MDQAYWFSVLVGTQTIEVSRIISQISAESRTINYRFNRSFTKFQISRLQSIPFLTAIVRNHSNFRCITKLQLDWIEYCFWRSLRWNSVWMLLRTAVLVHVQPVFRYDRQGRIQCDIVNCQSSRFNPIYLGDRLVWIFFQIRPDLGTKSGNQSIWLLASDAWKTLQVQRRIIPNQAPEQLSVKNLRNLWFSHRIVTHWSLENLFD